MLVVRSESQDRRRPSRCSACGSGRLAVVGERAAPLAQKQQRRRDWWISIIATRRDPTHKSSSAAQNQEPRVSGARPSLCADTAKGRHPNLFAKTLLDDLPSNCIFPAPDTVHIRSAPGSQRKNYGKRPATDVHCSASSTSPSLTAPSSVSCDPGRRDAKLSAGDSVSAAGSLARAAKEPGVAWTAAALSILPGPPMAATPGARVVVLRFDQAQADQSPVLIHALDRVAVEL